MSSQLINPISSPISKLAHSAAQAALSQIKNINHFNIAVQHNLVLVASEHGGTLIQERVQLFIQAMNASGDKVEFNLELEQASLFTHNSEHYELKFVVSSRVIYKETVDEETGHQLKQEFDYYKMKESQSKYFVYPRQSAPPLIKDAPKKQEVVSSQPAKNNSVQPNTQDSTPKTSHSKKAPLPAPLETKAPPIMRQKVQEQLELDEEISFPDQENLVIERQLREKTDKNDKENIILPEAAFLNKEGSGVPETKA